ncbi:myeloid-associated differentiation marker homolog [Paralichthys olivaceus]|uniref:myeloid-associated differentiation marker homolog n=1 Tax=Paralichthys olivaceus TaxID=8255 RepID=UPI00097D6D79|nr:PREDICTED: myeloid-associated differentiation marker homolog [Paralichthys olivaceus]XP_019963705.1 PREDICTED: myeloid-associated differentiation marker homolog [Paralichthys olivaceus]XP_019963706.1 PREDICTED: myeloid-associated differentiation marker homolog [Paralichthys olivaceus]
MPLIVFPTSQLLWVRVAALLFTCVAFSVAAHGAMVTYGHTHMYDWCIFCWAFSFACTLLVLLVQQFGLQARIPVSWSNFPITIACYAALLCISASVIFPLFFLKGQQMNSEARDHRIVSTVFSCLAAVAYMGEVSLTKARPGEVAGYMATAPGLLKVFQTFVACIIFILVSEHVSYDRLPALKWCMAVYCICFILSMAVVVLCVGECTGWLPIPFSKFLSAYGLLAVIMYLTATIIWPVFQFDEKYKARGSETSNLIAVAVLTALNFLLYLADLVYTGRLVFLST